MRKTEIHHTLGIIAGACFLVAATMCGSALAQSAPGTKGDASAIQDSIVTVDQLLKIENAAALEKAKKDALASGLIKPEVLTARKGAGATPAATLKVWSIAGVGDALRADIQYNEQAYEHVGVGAHIGRCIITHVKDRAVVLAPLTKRTPASQCPTGHWTGIAEVLPLLPPVAPHGAGAGAPMPAPIPLPAGSVMAAPKS